MSQADGGVATEPLVVPDRTHELYQGGELMGRGLGGLGFVGRALRILRTVERRLQSVPASRGGHAPSGALHFDGVT